MDTSQINFPFLSIFIVNVLFLIGWVILSIFTLMALKKLSNLTNTAKTILALLIVLVPWLGALGFWVLCPSFHAVNTNY